MNVGLLHPLVTSILKRLGLLSAAGTNAAALGPSSSTDNAIARYDGTSGKLIQSSSVTIDDSGNVVTPSGAGVVVGGADTSGVKLKVDTGTLVVREGDDSAYTNLACARVQVLSGSTIKTDLLPGATGLSSDSILSWSSTTASGGSKDVGLKRAAAGVLQVTDGSTGVGHASASSFNTTDGTNAQASVINSGGGRVKVGSGGGVHWSSTTAAAGSSDTALVRPEAKAVQPTDANTGNGYFYLGEVASAPTGTANVAKLYAVDNGAGKTQLVVIFGSGAAQVIATEP